MKPWPKDCITIVCATPQEANRSKMESVNPGQCRDCGTAIVYDGRTMRRALEIERYIARRHNLPFTRPIKFFCLECYSDYEVQQCDLLVDHSGGKSVEYGALPQ